MYIVLIRTLMLYFFVVLSMRLMGKKQIGQLQPFELVTTIMISELASLPMSDTKIPLISGIIAIATLLMLQCSISLLQLKSEFSRKLFCGEPSILIKDGKIDIDELKRQKFTINDLMEELRLNGYFNLGDIEYAILETSGQISIIPKSDVENVKRSDLKIKSQQESLPVTLILDSKVNMQNLKLINKNLEWLKGQLRKNNIQSEKDVFLALMDSNGKFYFQKRSDKP